MDINNFYELFTQWIASCALITLLPILLPVIIRFFLREVSKGAYNNTKKTTILDLFQNGQITTSIYAISINSVLRLLFRLGEYEKGKSLVVIWVVLLLFSMALGALVWSSVISISNNSQKNNVAEKNEESQEKESEGNSAFSDRKLNIGIWVGCIFTLLLSFAADVLMLLW